MPTAEPALVRSLGSVVERRGLVLVAPTRPWRQLGEPEVENLGVAGARDEDVRRLDVAVHDPLLVRRRQRLGHLGAELQQHLGIHRPA